MAALIGTPTANSFRKSLRLDIVAVLELKRVV
jgi:hypothetical protein